MPIDTTKTGAAIAAYRLRMNMSQQGLAGLMNVTHQAVSKWEKGLALPDTETLLALAKLFGASMEDLLMGKLPKEPEPETVEEAEIHEETVPEQEEAAEAVQDAELGDLDFSSIKNMLPFVSAKVVDRLFLTYAQSSNPDAGKLRFLAPFVSSQVLSDYISTLPVADYSWEILTSLACFLPTKTVDHLILGMEGPIPLRMMNALMPFASSKAIDSMVLKNLGMKPEEETSDDDYRMGSGIAASPEQTNEKSASIGQQIAEKARRAMEPKQPSARRESPRMRLVRMAVQKENADMICELADDLNDGEKNALCLLLLEKDMYDVLSELLPDVEAETQRMMLNKAIETSDDELITTFCEIADDLDTPEQEALCMALLQMKRYEELGEMLDALSEDMQHALLDKAMEADDDELLALLSENL